MLAVCTLLVILAADPAPPKDSGTPRKPHPLAPSLPELTDKEEAELDRLIDKFIAADTGKLSGLDAKKAMDDFKQLGPEASFALIRGFNKSAHIGHSCPALTIGRKLTSILRATNDIELLQFAKENVGAGVKKTRHGDVIREIKMGCTQRITYVKNLPNPEPRNVPPPK
jgi:hypothetical protein